jgi:predicted outer membrane protein
LGPADRDLLAKVRQAGLWEMPTGQQMQQRASSQRVREVGGAIATEHQQLDTIVRDTASKLGVLLPSQPTDEQRGWMDQISAQSGADYDRVAVNLLRLAHGRVLPILAAERSGTRNALIRQFADIATEFVHRHHTYLESTGLVDFAALPEAPAPASAAPAPPQRIDITQVPGAKVLDAPLCYQCGSKMQPAGSCYVCGTCGSTSGCS